MIKSLDTGEKEILRLKIRIQNLVFSEELSIRAEKRQYLTNRLTKFLV